MCNEYDHLPDSFETWYKYPLEKSISPDKNIGEKLLYFFSPIFTPDTPIGYSGVLPSRRFLERVMGCEIDQFWKCS